MFKVKVVVSAKLHVELNRGNQLGELRVESNLKRVSYDRGCPDPERWPGRPSREGLTLSRVMGSMNGEMPEKKALIHQLSS
jgi:hypothetical protein